MRQTDLVAAFLAGETSGEAKSLSIVGEQLVHYNTAIAERYGDRIILNYTRYSLATGKVQKLLTDAVDPAVLVYVSGVPSDTRTTLVDYLPDRYGDEVVPADYLLRIGHRKFGEGYVLSIADGSMTCLFGKQEKTLLYPLVIESGVVEILEDRR